MANAFSLHGLQLNAGESDYADLGSDRLDGERFTVSLWFESTEATSDGDYNVLFSQGGARVLFVTHEGKLAGEFRNAAGQKRVISYAENVDHDGLWHHAVVSYDAAAKEVRLYLDGQPPQTGTHTVLSTHRAEGTRTARVFFRL